MNSRERILTALDGGEPDRVPIVPHVGWYASVVLGISLDDFIRESMIGPQIPGTGYIPTWRYELESYSKLGADVITWVRSYALAAKETTRESFEVRNDPKGILVHKTYETPKGPLTEEILSSRQLGVDNRKYLITNPEEDLEKVEYVLGDASRLDFEEYERARYQVGDKGIVAAHCNSPMVFWLTMRGLQEGLLDFFRRPATVEKYLKMFGNWLVDFARACGEYQVDLLWVRGTYDGYTIIRPEQWERYLKEPLTKAFKEAGGVKTTYFLEGKCARLLDLVKETGVNCLQPIESPPQGDCDLAEVKARIGSDICLMGNISPFELELSSTGSVEKIVIDKIRAAALDGGYILSTTDMITQGTPIQNVVALVGAAKEYGRYPIGLPS